MADLASPVERNIITILAVDMVGSTRHISGCDPEDAQSFLDLWFEHIRVAVERAGGLIVHFAGDGGIAMFVGQAPLRIMPSALAGRHGISPKPAVHRTAGRRRPVPRRRSLRAGRVAPGASGGRFRFDIAGTTVHIAAKLQQGARPAKPSSVPKL